MTKRKNIAFALALLSMGIIIGYVSEDLVYDNDRPVVVAAPSAHAPAPLVNPTVTAGLGKRFIVNFQPLKESFLNIQSQYKQKTFIYFSYLNNASWVGLNERDNFVAASLVKVPLAMSVYKAIEDGKLTIDQKYTITNEDLDSGFGDLYKTGLDKTFTVDGLLKIMLENSDNTAKNALLNVLRGVGITNPLEPVYEAFGWTFDFGEAPDFRKINVKTLSNMFLALYNAQFLNIDHSQAILSYLDDSPFDDKIVAGVPKDIPVAHKIGVSINDETFSDCGVVYVPNRNYILCLGSNGGDEKITASFMAKISKAAYAYVIAN